MEKGKNFMIRKSAERENYLERYPMRAEKFEWFADKRGFVTLKIENIGLFHWIAQKLLGKPRFQYVHLDKLGSFVWTIMDGEKDMIALGKLVGEEFGDEAEPLYERLASFFRILDSYSFICWK